MKNSFLVVAIVCSFVVFGSNAQCRVVHHPSGSSSVGSSGGSSTDPYPLDWDNGGILIVDLSIPPFMNGHTLTYSYRQPYCPGQSSQEYRLAPLGATVTSNNFPGSHRLASQLRATIEQELSVATKNCPDDNRVMHVKISLEDGNQDFDHCIYWSAIPSYEIAAEDLNAIRAQCGPFHN